MPRRLCQLRHAALLVAFGAVCALCTPPAASAAGALQWHAPHAVDVGAPFGDPAVIGQLACPSTSLCVGVDTFGGIATSTHPGSPTARWHLTAQLAPTITFYSISCPSVTLCVAINQAGGEGDTGRIAVSTDPTGPASAWKISRLGTNSLQNVSCPTTSLCVIDTLQGLYYSTDPTGGASTWKSELHESLGASSLLAWVSCASASLCVVAGTQGAIFTSTDPAGGTSTWRRVASLSQLDFDYVDCPSTSVCVAVDNNGGVAASSDPAAADPPWVSEGQLSLGEGDVPAALSCTPAGVCVVVDDGGEVAATSDPTGPVSGWTVTPGVDSAGFETVICEADGPCLAPDSGGEIATSSAPASSTPGWRISHQLGGYDSLDAIACPSVSLCVATVDGGDIVSSTHPTAATGHWRVVKADPGASLDSISCPSSRFCAAIGAADRLVTSDDPTGPATAWKPATLGITYFDNNGDTNQEDWEGIACPSARECVAGNDWYGLGFSADPAGGRRKWSLLSVGEYDYDEFFAASCVPASFCVAVGLEGSVAVSPNWNGSLRHLAAAAASGLSGVSCPSVSLCVAIGGHSVYVIRDPRHNTGWTHARIDSATLSAISCGSVSLCAAIDEQGRVLVSTDPGGGPAAWQTTAIDPGHALNGVACVGDEECVVADSGGDIVAGTR